jgi:ABC-type Fe3+/spermidine/putrescine transport system ATPase subunit
MATITIENVSKFYQSKGGDKQALRNVSLRIQDKEFFSLLGPSGCGKTTLLRSVAGFFGIDSGTIRIGDTEMTNQSMGVQVPPERRSLGMVFQSYAVWPHMTVAENVVYPLRVQKRGSRERADRLARALEQVRLEGLEHRYPAELSGGQQQRIALARAIITQPAALLLDEPLSNLDARLRSEMRFELKELQQKLGLTILYVTHDQEEALAMSDRIAVMSEGMVEQIGTPQEIYDRPASAMVAGFLGKTSILHGTWLPPGSLKLGTEVVDVPVVVEGIDPDVPEAEVIVAIRYAAITISARRDTPETLGGVHATVRVSTFMGDYWLHELELDDGQTVVAMGDLHDRVPAPGTLVFAHIRRAHLFSERQ